MRSLRTILVGPSRYDGRQVAVFRYGISPNGALGALAGLIEDYNRRFATQRRIDYEVFDEHVREAIHPELLRQWRDRATADGTRFVLMICGTQTATYPRARDVALMARAEGIDVIIGGVHISAHAPSVDFLISCGVRVAIGEVEPLWDELVEDAFQGKLQPVYKIGNKPGVQGIEVKSATSSFIAPDIWETPFPHIPPAARGRYINPGHLFIDGSRGCPFLCTFCVVKNVFGRTVRSRDPERLVAWMGERVRNDGTRAFTFTDDNFSRNPRHLEILEGLAKLRAEGLKNFVVWLILDVESACYAAEKSVRGEKTRRFLDLCEAAGVSQVYMGLESTNDAVLQEMRKGVNRDRHDIHGNAMEQAADETRRRLIQRYKAAVDAWHNVGVTVECGYILGFAADQAGCGIQAARDLNEIGVDMGIFYLVAPLPGAEDYARAVREKTLVNTDFNQYFQAKPMMLHPTMTQEELKAEFDAAVRELWSWTSVIRRVAGGVLGWKRRRARAWLNYLKMQIGYRVILSAGNARYVEAGLFKRSGPKSSWRQAITDEEARRVYLRDLAPPSHSVTRFVVDTDEASMLSLPILSR